MIGPLLAVPEDGPQRRIFCLPMDSESPSTESPSPARLQNSTDFRDPRGDSMTLKGTVSLFGFPPSEAEVEVRPRSTAWRGSRTAFFLGGGLALAPIVGLVPPHAPWAAAALGIGGFLGIRKWRERFTVLGGRGKCPKCGGSLSLRPGTALRPHLSMPCDQCHHDSRLTVPSTSEVFRG
jgi:hypothetical protein